MKISNHHHGFHVLLHMIASTIVSLPPLLSPDHQFQQKSPTLISANPKGGQYYSWLQNNDSGRVKISKKSCTSEYQVTQGKRDSGLRSNLELLVHQFGGLGRYSLPWKVESSSNFRTSHQSNSLYFPRIKKKKLKEERDWKEKEKKKRKTN